MAEVQPVREFVASVVSALHNLEVRHSEPRVTPLPYFETMAIFDQVLAAHDAEVAAKALEAIADEWQMGGWTVVTPALRTLEDRLAAADVMTTWLRVRATAARAEAQR